MPALDKEVPIRKEALLRRDLKALSQYLQQATGVEGLAEGLSRARVRRIMEVGTGIEFEAIQQLSALENEQKEPLFSQKDLLVVDPELWYWTWTNATLKYTRDPFINKYSRKPATVEDIAERIKKGDILPFDLVFAHGVVSWGGLFGYHHPDESFEEVRMRGKETIMSMRDCLNPHNQNSLEMLSCKAEDSVLPFTQEEFGEMELEVVHAVHAEETTDSPARGWRLYCLSEGTLTRDDPLFSLVICRRK